MAPDFASDLFDRLIRLMMRPWRSLALMIGSRRVLPGYGLSLGLTLTYLSLIVLIPLSAAFLKAAGLGWDDFLRAAWSERAQAAYALSFGASALAAIINAVLGLLVAWVLVRYPFPGKSLLDALIDLPFALPTAVAGLVYWGLYSRSGFLGQFLTPFLDDVTQTRLAIVMVLVFTGFPFVVRAVQPVLESLEPELEESALTLGANRWQTFLWVLLPNLVPSLVTGLALAFARALGEYGSVVFISTHERFRTEIAPMLIVEFLSATPTATDVNEASAVAVVLLVASFGLLIVINVLERWSQRHG